MTSEVSPDALPIASARDTRRAAVRLITRRPWQLTLALASLLGGSASALAVPAMLGRVVDSVRGHLNSSLGLDAAVAQVITLVLVMLAALVVSAMLAHLAQLLIARIAQAALADLREDVFASALALPSDRVERAGTGDLVSRVGADAEAVNTVISRILPAFLSAAFTIALTLTGMAVLDWRYALAPLVVVPLQLFALRRFLRQSGPVYRGMRAAEANRAQNLIESIDGADTVRSLRTQLRQIERVDASSRAAIAFDLRAVRLRTIFFGRLNFAEYIGLSAVLVVGFVLVSDGSSTIGDVTAAALYFHALFNPIGVVLAYVDELQNAGSGLARLFGVASPPTTESTPPVVTSEAADIALALRGVSFGYADREVVHPITLVIRHGERVALVGASGAGKSTLAKIAAGSLVPPSGTVYRSGPEGAKARVTMISQEVHTFRGTVADNLGLGSATPRTLPLPEWIDRLPQGAETRVGAGGCELTAAQAQHLALLRVANLDPHLVILDEATSEAGTTDAALLDAATAEALRGRTALVIAHRLSQAELCDRIVVMDAGRIVEQGTPAQLRAAGGAYARLRGAAS